MTLLNFILLLLVAGVCGGVAQTIVGYSHRGWLNSIALGFVGALLGSWLAGALGLGELLALRIGDGTSDRLVDHRRGAVRLRPAPGET